MILSCDKCQTDYEAPYKLITYTCICQICLAKIYQEDKDNNFGQQDL